MDRFLEFAGNNTVLVSLLMISFFVLVFSELRRKASGLVSVDPGGAVAMINADAVVVDLRSAESFARGHIVNAKNLPLDELDAKIDKVLGSKDRPVIAVCDSGSSSNKAVMTLRQSGYERAVGLKGGMNAWNQAGLPVVGAKKTKTKK